MDLCDFDDGSLPEVAAVVGVGHGDRRQAVFGKELNAFRKQLILQGQAFPSDGV